MRAGSFLAQLWALLAVFLREWPLTVASLVVPIVGTAGTTFILVSILAVSHGISHAMSREGADDVALVLDRDALIESSSHIADEAVAAIIDALSADPGARIISPELVQTVDTLSRGGEAGAQVLARGIGEAGVALRKQFRIVEGRAFTPGTLEVIVGRQLARDFAGLAIGTTLTGGTQEWLVVGVFEAGGGTAESEVWMDIDSARMESGSRVGVSSIRVQPMTPPQLAAFREIVLGSPQLQVRAESQLEHQARQFSQAIERTRLFALALALLLGAGAWVASVNTMSASIVRRERAVATLRALGFAPSATVAAVFVETVLLGVLGGAVGASVAFFVADGYGLSILNGATGTPFALSASVTVGSLLQGVSLATVLTVLAAIAPSRHGARSTALAAGSGECALPGASRSRD